MFGIRGCKGRGNEVIEFLEMLGGVRVYDRIDGEDEDVYYYCTTRDVILDAPKNGHRVLRLKRLFDLDEILEENPYRVGDEVYTFGLDERVRIEKMVARKYGVWYMTTNMKANGYADNFSYDPL
jgi:hypothetical protein